jgi:hypothetical protein
MDPKTKVNAAATEFLKSEIFSETYTVSYTLSHIHKLSSFISHNLREDV